jgi:GYF domain 2/PilZ domain
MNTARIWFYFANENQVGPLSFQELEGAVQDGALHQQDYVFRDGYKDWIFAKDVPELQVSFQLSSTLASSAAVSSAQTVTNATSATTAKLSLVNENSSSRVNPGLRSLRVVMEERVVAHNEQRVVSGKIENISVSGVFFHTSEEVFGLNDSIKLTLKEGKGLGKPVQLQGIVVRKSNSTQGPNKTYGYGIELRSIDDASRTRIEDYISRHKAS